MTASTDHLGNVGNDAPRGLGFDPKWIVVGVCIAIVVFLAAIPLCFLLWQSFFTPQTASKAAEFTFQNYVKAYGDPETVKLLFNSVTFTTGAALFAFFVGTFLAWLNER